MLQLVVKNDNTGVRTLPQLRPADHLRLVVSRSEHGTRIERLDLADRLAMEWRESFLPTADQVRVSGARVVQLFDRPSRLQLLPAHELRRQPLMDEPLSPQ